MSQVIHTSTIAYVDGYNLYHGIIDYRNIVPKGYQEFSKTRPWGNLLWLDLERFIKSYNFPNTNLEKIKFFEAPSFKPDSLKRQQIYKNALLSLSTMDETSFFGGEFKSNDVSCQACGATYTHHTEKKTDVLLAVELMRDFHLGLCDNAIIVSGDTDQIPTVEKISHDDPNFLVYIIFPPHRCPQELKNLVGSLNTRKIKYQRVVNNQFNDTLFVNGHEIKKPIAYFNS